MKLDVSANHLAFGSQSDNLAHPQQALQALGRYIPADEAGKRAFGSGTAAVLKTLQTDFNVPATRIVNPATVTAIHTALAKLATDPRFMRGSVGDADDNLVEGLYPQDTADTA